MIRYRKISTRIWNDQKFMGMSDAGKLAFMFMLTHPHMTPIGGMRATLPGLGAELGWTAEAFREAFREACSKGMAEHDERAAFVVLPNFLKHNGPESPNVVKSWVGCLDDLPECDLKLSCIRNAISHLEGMSEAFRKALPEAFREALSKAMPNQKQKQEQIRERDTHARESAPSVSFDAATEHAKALIKAGDIPPNRVNPTHPDLLQAVASGITPDELVHTAREFAGSSKCNVSYVCRVAMSRRQEALEKPHGSDRPARGAGALPRSLADRAQDQIDARRDAEARTLPARSSVDPDDGDVRPHLGEPVRSLARGDSG